MTAYDKRVNQQRGGGYLSTKVKVENAGEKGKGLFCADTIKKNEILVGYAGRIVSKSKLLRGKKKYLRDAIQLNDEFFLACLSDEDLEPNDNLNHACEPNAGFQGDITIIAMRDIRIGEEITIDYAMVDNLLELRMQCKCGSAQCRGVISGRDWLVPELQKKYDGYFSFYISNKIKSNADTK